MTRADGPIKRLASIIGFKFQDTALKVITAAMLLDVKQGGLKAYGITLGGPTTNIYISFSNQFGLDRPLVGSLESTIEVPFNPEDIMFHQNNMVSEYVLINKCFKCFLANPGVYMN